MADPQDPAARGADTAASGAADAHTRQPGLAGRKVAVTGGTTGIGRAIAVLLASEGARVFVCGRDSAHLADALARIREVGDGDGLALDLAERENVARFFSAAEAYLGGLDIAVINAAVPADALMDEDEDDLAYRIAVDFSAYLHSAQAAIGRMGAGSDIVLIGSMSAVSQSPGGSVYVAAKTGIEGFAHALRGEVADRDIKVGLIEPGLTGADFQYPDLPPEEQRALIRRDEMLRAEDIAVATHFMLTQPRRCAVSLMRVESRLRR
ncbi:SDR family oxidoreductase [Sphingobium lignivorans]|uniref:NADP-dependent 3-hydroxy acid dehydrogenase YdfG n=1 Tax=Sphingobium lignivorans TaxID=2735886 RepID=A0ABR6NHW5_9SPHN|nr:SDR family oxidoreductase [Sphingobium lignivorans]MBB5986875.1 NADP-dependent 3-hydroxy acid dehydrogenase YdfG [Sphingobium lignivorans]